MAQQMQGIAAKEGFNMADAFTPSVKPLDPSRIRFKQLDETTPMDPVDYFFQTGFKHLIQEQIAVTKQVADQLTNQMDQPDVQAVIENLKAEQKEKTAIAQRENVAALWEEYDRDKNGVLQPQELEKLLHDLWLVEKKNLSVTTSAIMEQSMKMGLEVALNIAKAQGATPQELQETEGAMAMMSGLMKIQIPIMEKASLEMMQRRDANLAVDVQQMLANMDVNHDGVVTRDEFELKFLEAYQKVNESMQMPQGMGSMPGLPGMMGAVERPVRVAPKPGFNHPIVGAAVPRKAGSPSQISSASVPRPATVLPSAGYAGNLVTTATSRAPLPPGMYGGPISGAQIMYRR
jgi:Ca2+-binding EF-hand superfamily protein